METKGQFNRLSPPFNFKGWIEENRHLLKPPVSNKVVFKEGNFIIQVVGGPNSRTDFHVNQTDEFFYQLEGNMFLRVLNESGAVEEIYVKEGEIFLLPGGVPHSPQRAEHSVGLVIEKRRQAGDMDGLLWVCSKCHKQLYSEFFHLENIETQFKAVFERFYNSDHVKCTCGNVNGRVW